MTFTRRQSSSFRFDEASLGQRLKAMHFLGHRRIISTSSLTVTTLLPLISTGLILLSMSKFCSVPCVSVLSFGLGHSFGPIPAPGGWRNLCFVHTPFRKLAPQQGRPEKRLLTLGAGGPHPSCPKTHKQNQVESLMALNKLNLIGFVGADAEAKQTPRDHLTRFFPSRRIASRKNEAGEWQSKPKWHRCVANGKIGGLAVTVKKGSMCTSKANYAAASSKKMV